MNADAALFASLEEPLRASVSFTVPGTPQGKGRARFARQGGFMRAYTPEKTVAYEGLIALAAQEAMKGRELLEGPLIVCVFATFHTPPSWSKKKKAATRWHTGKPDADNVLKAVGDGCNGIVWKDDSQIASVSVMKRYGETPGLYVIAEPV